MWCLNSDSKVVNVFVIETLCHSRVRLMVGPSSIFRTEASSTINQCIFVGAYDFSLKQEFFVTVRALDKLGRQVSDVGLVIFTFPYACRLR